MRDEKASFTQNIITAAKELADAAIHILDERIDDVSPELREKLLTDAERNAYMAEETYKNHGNFEDDSSGLNL